jgi:hypothetical protein
MSYDKKKGYPARHLVSRLSALLLACAMLLAAPAAFAIDSGDIVVVSTKGEVHITVNGAAHNVRAGGVLELPATVRTGRDGNVELRQGATTVSVGPETLLEFPALEKRGAPIDRILQPRGNAFYNIGKREGRKLRVETPYLVGVIKGTQFNVAAQGEATTISLFEGLLEVRATDDSDVVDLKAGEIASRKRGDKSISVIKMDAGKAPPAGPRPPAGSGSNNNGTPSPTVPRVTPSNEGGESLLVDRGAGNTRADIDAGTDVRPIGSVFDTGAATSVVAGNSLDAAASVVVNTGGTGIDAGADVNLGVGNSVNVVANAAANIGASGVDVVTSVGVDVGPVAADLGVSAAVDVAAGTVDVSAGTAVDVGPVNAALDTAASVDLGAGTVDVSAGATVDAGPVTAGLDTSTGVDLGAGTIEASTSVGVDAGPLTTDVGAGAAVDLSSGTVDTGIDVGVSAPVVDVDLGAAASVDVAAGTVDLGVDIAGTGIDLGVDVGDTVDTVETVTETVTEAVTETVTDTVVDVGGLLDGLLRRPGRK